MLTCPCCHQATLEVWPVTVWVGTDVIEHPMLVVHCRCALSEAQEDAILVQRPALAEQRAERFAPD